MNPDLPDPKAHALIATYPDILTLISRRCHSGLGIWEQLGTTQDSSQASK